MEAASKRKRKINIKIEFDENSSEDNDDEYVPKAPKKKVRKVEPSKKIVKKDIIDEAESEMQPLQNVINQTKFITDVEDIKPAWNNEDVVAENSGIPVHIAQNIIKLLDADATIPFIVRYRREATGGMQAEKLREVQTAYEDVKSVHKKVDTILKSLKEKLDANATFSLLSAKTLDEVELLYAPFKPANKQTLSVRSRQLGLDIPALKLMKDKCSLHDLQLHSYIKNQKGLENEKNILSGIQYIIADIISKDRQVLDLIRDKINSAQIRIIGSKSMGAEKCDRQAHVEGKTTQNYKYENYFNFNVSLSHVAPHQIMALNRGEKEKVLKVKVEIPTFIQKSMQTFVWTTFFGGKKYDKSTFEYLKSCCEDAYNRLIEPYMSRQIRSSLSKKAEKESISVFGSNLRSLLLTPPLRGKTIIGIDPGFAHGCKVSVVSSKGEVLKTDVIYPHKNIPHSMEAGKLLRLVSSSNADVVALGNGTACRETESWLSQLIQADFFHPIKLKYCIVDESGASIYSVTKEAEAELPNLDPNLRSAVSIARRLQDPLLEFVKVDPKHLGVGMYQHDVSDVQLKKTLDNIVEECVSFVGVDLNVCPEIMLRRVAGLSAARAKAIVEWRLLKGAFINRQQLREIKGLGPKTFQQCAGFVRILPCTAVGFVKEKTKGDFNPLDTTIIHPESYDTAKKFLKELKIDIKEIGLQSAVSKVEAYMTMTNAKNLSAKFDVPEATIVLIIDALKQLQDYDMRQEFDQPLFRTSICSFADLQVGQELTGQVRNVTSFGCFVDIGVGSSGLLHISKMKGRRLGPGDRVTVLVISTDAVKKRISLDLKL